MKIFDVPLQNLRVIDDLSAQGTRILPVTVIVNQMLIVVLRLDQFTAIFADLKLFLKLNFTFAGDYYFGGRDIITHTK